MNKKTKKILSRIMRGSGGSDNNNNNNNEWKTVEQKPTKPKSKKIPQDTSAKKESQTKKKGPQTKKQGPQTKKRMTQEERNKKYGKKAEKEKAQQKRVIAHKEKTTQHRDKSFNLFLKAPTRKEQLEHYYKGNLKNIIKTLLYPVNTNFNCILKFITKFNSARLYYFNKILEIIEGEEDGIEIKKLPSKIVKLQTTLDNKKSKLEDADTPNDKKKIEKEINDIREELKKLNNYKTKYYSKIAEAFRTNNVSKLKTKLKISDLKVKLNELFEEVNGIILDETVDPPQQVKHISYTQSIFNNSIFKKLFNNESAGDGEIYKFVVDHRGPNKHSLIKVKESELTKATETEGKDSDFMKLFNKMVKNSDEDSEDYYQKLLDGVFNLAYIEAQKTDMNYNIEKPKNDTKYATVNNALGNNMRGMVNENPIQQNNTNVPDNWENWDPWANENDGK